MQHIFDPVLLRIGRPQRNHSTLCGRTIYYLFQENLSAFFTKSSVFDSFSRISNKYIKLTLIMYIAKWNRW